MSELSEAIKSGDPAAVSRILDRDPASADATENGVPMTLFALYVGQTEIATLIASRRSGLTFHEACALGEMDRVAGMLRGTPSLLNERSPDGFPPLGLAIFFRQPGVARFLVEQGADVNAQAENALRVAPVHAAAAACDHDIMRLLIDRGGDANARQQMDYTALHGAASRGDIEMGKMLVEAGADPNARGTDGATSSDVATKYGHPEFAEFLATAILLPKDRVPQRSDGG